MVSHSLVSMPNQVEHKKRLQIVILLLSHPINNIMCFVVLIGYFRVRFSFVCSRISPGFFFLLNAKTGFCAAIPCSSWSFSR